MRIGLLIIVVLMLGACGHSPSAPTVQAVAANGAPVAICFVPTIKTVDVDMSAPKLIIDVAGSVVVEVERFDNSNRWVPWQGSPVTQVGPVSLDVWFNQHYRVRARLANCAEWSDWVVKTVGPANLCAACANPPAPPFSTMVCTDTVFTGNVVAYLPVAVPAGNYRVDVETKDAAHAPGYQPDQTQEVVTVRGIGTTEDIPEAATSHVTAFTVILPTLTEVVIEGGRDSVHGVCVSFRRE